MEEGFPGSSTVKNLPASAGDAGEVGLIPGSGRSSGEVKWQPTPVFLPGEFYGQRTLVGYSAWVTKSWTELRDGACMHT